MKFGKIRIENGYLAFNRHMVLNSLPVREITWAYLKRSVDHTQQGLDKHLVSNHLVIVTKRKKIYYFEMTEKEVRDCLRLLKALNSDLVIGFPMGTRLPLLSLPNTRDLGGLMARDGRHIMPHRLIRSGNLYHTSLADQQILSEEYQIRTIIDLRTGAERKQKPDVILPFVEYFHIPLLDSGDILDSGDLFRTIHEFEPDPALYMNSRYRKMIRDPACISALARIMDILLSREDEPVIWHSMLGKDRAGLVTAIVLYVLGIPRATIIEDYARSEGCLAEEGESLLRQLEARGYKRSECEEKVNAFMGSRPVCMNIVFRTLESDYGSMARFLRKGLFLTPKAIEHLRDKYLI